MNTKVPSTIRLSYALPETNWCQPLTRLPKQSRWGELAWLVTTLTLVFLAWCLVGAAVAPDGAPWSLYVLNGMGCGGAFGILFALPGCLQRTHRRSYSAHALLWNGLLIVPPTLFFGFMIVFSILFRCCS